MAASRAFFGAFAGRVVAALFIALCIYLGYGPDWLIVTLLGEQAWPWLARGGFLALALATLYFLLLSFRRQRLAALTIVIGVAFVAAGIGMIILGARHFVGDQTPKKEQASVIPPAEVPSPPPPDTQSVVPQTPETDVLSVGERAKILFKLRNKFPDRLIADVTPEYLMDQYKGKMLVEGDRVIAPYIGNWHLLSGQLNDMSIRREYGYAMVTFIRKDVRSVQM